MKTYTATKVDGCVRCSRTNTDGLYSKTGEYVILNWWAKESNGNGYKAKKISGIVSKYCEQQRKALGEEEEEDEEE